MAAHFDPFDPTSPESRYEALAELRRTSPVQARGPGAWLVTSLSGVQVGLKNVDHFVGSFGDAGQLREEDQVLSAIAEPRHGKIRRVFNSVLAYHHVSKAEPFVRSFATELLDATLALARRRGEVDLVEHYVRKLPSGVIAHVLGVPERDFERFAVWSDEVLEGQGGDDSPFRPISEIHPEFTAYLDGLIALRRDPASAPDDIITRLLHTEIDGERLSERAVRTQTMFLIIAGNETTRNLIGNAFFTLATQPALFERVRAERALVPVFVEESLRHDSPVQILARTCTKAIEIDGVRIEPGDRVIFSVASANRDEKGFVAPAEFRLDRPKARDHVGFGAGPHLCPGAFLARMETQIALELFLERAAALRLAPGYARDENPVFWAHGPRTLRVLIDEDPARA